MKKSKLLSKKDKADSKNELFDRIVNSGFFCYAALLIDNLEIPLFSGQVGEIQDVMIDEKHKNSYLVAFIDFENGENEFAYCYIKKEHLLPLFSFNSAVYENIITTTTFERKKNQAPMTLKQVQDKWKELEVYASSNLELAPHKKFPPRFPVGQLVTVQVDIFTENCTIQAGQTGIISDIKENDMVEVTFWSIPFGTLTLERNELVPASEN